MKAELGTFPKDRQILSEILPIRTPLGMDIHITHFCNFHCNYCVLTQSEADFKKSGLKREIMSWETFCLIVRQLKDFESKIKMITMSGIGEALTHPRLVDMVQLLHDANVTDKIQIITNASLLTPELSEKLVKAGLGELKISLQGLTAEKYKEISNVTINWDRFYENIKYFSSIRGSCLLKVKIADTAIEPSEEKKFYELFGDICDAVSIEHIYDVWKVQDANLDYHEKPTETTMYGLPLIDNTVCRYPFMFIDILPDGLYTTFCHLHFGFEKNIWDVPMEKQWNGKGQNELRLKMLEGKYGIPVCSKCSIVNNTYHPEDLLMGHEEEIRKRLLRMYHLEV
ncbi:MAG: radical SAM protein [Acidaminococcaceae bacterium]|nr:radical SAM protein [Acidaminococcaceae bacterium]